MNWQDNYQGNWLFSIIAAVVMHLLVFSLIFLGFMQNHKFLAAKKPTNLSDSAIDDTHKELVQAKLVDNIAVKKAINRQRQQKLAVEKNLQLKKAAAAKVIQESKLAAKKAQNDKILAEKKLSELQKEQAKTIQKNKELVAAKRKLQKEQNKIKVEQQELLQVKREISAQQKKLTLQKKQQLQAKKRLIDGAIEHYVEGIISRIEKNRQKFPLLPADLVANVTFKIRGNGSIHSIKLTKKSGSQAYDEQALRAVFKASPFEMPADGEILKIFMNRYSDGFTSGLKNEY